MPEGKGLVEVVVTPLPAETIDSSLYTEGTDGLRVLSTRYRTRAVKEDTRKEVRAKEEQIRTLKQEAERLQKEVQVIEQNLQLLTKLENFTGATMQHLTEKGLLNSEATIGLAKYVMNSRATESAKQVEIQQKFQANAEATEFATRELGELTAGASRTERDAVIVVDKEEPGGQGPAQLPGRRRDLAAPVPLPRRLGEGPGPARVPGGHRAADGRGLDRRRHDALDRPAAAQRHAARAARPGHHRRRARGDDGGPPCQDSRASRPPACRAGEAWAAWG